MGVLRSCNYPCADGREITVVDLGLIEEVRVKGGDVHISMLPLTAWCLLCLNVYTLVEERVRQLPGVGQVEVKPIWDTPWTPDRMSESARQQLSLPLEQLRPLREERIAREKGGLKP